ncbi:aminotransferase class V-fold PLP-dependent enzyme [Saccharolobus solfataricus]|uniref:NifS protein homolog (NifS) n=3 Tax=Saccharolobus solfataricus TaxID=2287 RepID=Q97WK1_SACS2|nr:aminotransferase class V-fold PLP-dependent enzyme [Saccharolobus solfataricus]AAK42385.1 NifS protein homolog (nifS) [Saccharolobus solfataricus P2]AKA72487.1 aminotransferase class V-fold PLP-dependent enzyme [Saccharolobus solfataricus]AKA75187.1 aminotransferase class V-fold PLP-dependent enzyme [Saccharolobus solfataricus]AKA77880.1 aminotransferase class V-fold PLP-dependent enzyme [Saccharolobus solfataricus]AZF67001.1 aminotransferase class V-fold PLP-dependent enzyme [Saccharolobus
MRLRDPREFRENVPVTRKYVYLNHASVSPTPLPSLFEAYRYLYEVANRGSIAVNEEEEDELYHIRSKISNLVGAYSDEISLIPNTSYGVNLVAHGLEWKGDDNIVTDNLEFPTVVYPFLKLTKKGVKINIVETNPYTFEEDIISHIDKNTRLVAISHVSFNTGLKVDVRKIVKAARENNTLVLLDIIQSAGAVKINVKELGIDFAIAGGYKWLMSPQGSGFIYVKRGLIEDPPFYGWKTSADYLDFNPNKFTLEKGPRRFEIGTVDLAANLSLAKSCEIIGENMELIESSVTNLSQFAIRLAKDHSMEVITPEDKRAGIVIVKVKKPKEIAKELLKENIVVSPRGEGIRISTHFYNTEEEVQKTIEKISELERKFN